MTLGFWRWDGRDFFNADSDGPFGDEGVSFFHRHSCVLHEHLRAFAATPGEIAKKMLPADTVCAGWSVDFRLAAFNYAGEVVHSPLQFRLHSMPTGRADYQRGVNLDALFPFR